MDVRGLYSIAYNIQDISSPANTMLHPTLTFLFLVLSLPQFDLLDESSGERTVHDYFLRDGKVAFYSYFTSTPIH